MLDKGINILESNIDLDIQEKLEINTFDTLHYYDLKDYFGVMTKGKLLLVYEDENGKRVLLKTFLRKGMILGGHKYLSDNKSFENFYYIAIEKVEILKISPTRSKELLENKDFLLQCLKDTKKDNYSLIQELVYRLDKDITKFLAYILLCYSEDKKITVKNFSLFAEFIKCSRSNFYIALGKLIDKGLIEKDGRVITIKDIERLEEFVEL